MDSLGIHNRCFEPIKKHFYYLVKNTLGLVNSYLLNHFSEKSIYNSDVVIVLIAKHDPNGALSVPTPIASFKLHNQNKTKIIYKAVSTIQDINSLIEKVKNQDNRIHGLWIHAHGNKTKFVLGPNEVCDEQTISQLQGSLQKLEDRAVVLLRCCEAGLSLAEKIAHLAPGRYVIGPKSTSNGFSFHFEWKDDSISAHFIGPKKIIANNLLQRVYNIFLSFLYAVSFGYYGEDFTARFCVSNI